MSKSTSREREQRLKEFDRRVAVLASERPLRASTVARVNKIKAAVAEVVRSIRAELIDDADPDELIRGLNALQRAKDTLCLAVVLRDYEVREREEQSSE